MKHLSSMLPHSYIYEGRNIIAIRRRSVSYVPIKIWRTHNVENFYIRSVWRSMSIWPWPCPRDGLGATQRSSRSVMVPEATYRPSAHENYVQRIRRPRRASEAALSPLGGSL